MIESNQTTVTGESIAFREENEEHFRLWKVRVNRAVEMIAGVGLNDLADWDFWGSFDAGDTPGEAARMLLADEGFGEGNW